MCNSNMKKRKKGKKLLLNIFFFFMHCSSNMSEVHVKLLLFVSLIIPGFFSGLYIFFFPLRCRSLLLLLRPVPCNQKCCCSFVPPIFFMLSFSSFKCLPLTLAASGPSLSLADPFLLSPDALVLLPFLLSCCPFFPPYFLTISVTCSLLL